MLHLAHTPPKPANHQLHVGLAHSNSEILEAQRLRYRVFADELGARLVIAYRNRNGNYSSVAELLKVSGIPMEMYNRVKDRVTVDSTVQRDTEVGKQAIVRARMAPRVSAFSPGLMLQQLRQKIDGVSLLAEADLTVSRLSGHYADPGPTLRRHHARGLAGSDLYLYPDHVYLHLDWADIMPRSGYVLYSNVLWFWVKKLYKLKTINKTKKNFNFLFYPWQKIPLSYFKETRRAKRLINYIKNGHNKLPHYLSFVNYSFWGKETDVYANLLACLLDLPDKKLQAKIADCLQKEKNNSPLPIKTCFHPIKQNDKLWRPYMLEHKQNHPEQYHNGGIWPFISCLWPMLIHKNGGQNKAWPELKKVARANKLNNWEFNEWLHGQTGKPLGMAGQSCNAGMFILAYHYLNNQIKI